ncbi:MAG: 50S ribosome-binding GTPase [Planctomycetes bacterium]|nr:50S ribosome-binding GTPase [Planctomycetota bacterium]
MDHATLTAALFTPRGRGAVSTIRFEGDCRHLDSANPPLFRAANGKSLSQQTIDRVVFGHWGTDDTTEEVVLCRTDVETVEIHCHGGDAAVGRILNDLESIGCRIQTWQQRQQETLGAFEGECLEALTQATTLRTARVLLEQQTGLLRKRIETLLEKIESQRDVVSRELNQLLRWTEFGLHLTRPWKVVLAGRPNVGKSSLINALLGFSRSLVFDQPGTTRDVVTAETAFEGWPVQLADTAGIRRQADRLESAGIDKARKMIAEADCRILLIDTSRPRHQEDRDLLFDQSDAIIVAHKSDLPCVWDRNILPVNALPVSSKTGAGVEKLAREIIARLIPEVAPPGTPIPITERQIEILSKARTAIENNDPVNCAAFLRECLA